MACSSLTGIRDGRAFWRRGKCQLIRRGCWRSLARMARPCGPPSPRTSLGVEGDQGGEVGLGDHQHAVVERVGALAQRLDQAARDLAEQVDSRTRRRGPPCRASARRSSRARACREALRSRPAAERRAGSVVCSYHSMRAASHSGDCMGSVDALIVLPQPSKSTTPSGAPPRGYPRYSTRAPL